MAAARTLIRADPPVSHVVTENPEVSFPGRSLDGGFGSPRILPREHNERPLCAGLEYMLIDVIEPYAEIVQRRRGPVLS